MVMPFLIRRVGFQFAYYMTATTLTMDAGNAHSVRLVDELSDNLPDARRKIGIRLGRLQTETIQNLKNYFLRMHPIPPETKTYAVNETTRLALSPGVLTNINNYVQHGAFPWESAR
jgi:polyketide biosynthesis enoyl-CoA hydratase PksH